MFFYRKDGSKFLIKDNDIYNFELIDKMIEDEDSESGSSCVISNNDRI